MIRWSNNLSKRNGISRKPSTPCLNGSFLYFPHTKKQSQLLHLPIACFTMNSLLSLFMSHRKIDSYLDINFLMLYFQPIITVGIYSLFKITFLCVLCSSVLGYTDTKLSNINLLFSRKNWRTNTWKVLLFFL